MQVCIRVSAWCTGGLWGVVIVVAAALTTDIGAGGITYMRYALAFSVGAAGTATVFFVVMTRLVRFVATRTVPIAYDLGRSHGQREV